MVLLVHNKNANKNEKRRKEEKDDRQRDKNGGKPWYCTHTHTHTHTHVSLQTNEQINNGYTLSNSAVLLSILKNINNKRHKHRLFSYVHFLCT